MPEALPLTPSALARDQERAQLRDHFAAAALTGLASGLMTAQVTTALDDTLADRAYQLADAMLAARENNR